MSQSSARGSSYDSDVGGQQNNVVPGDQPKKPGAVQARERRRSIAAEQVVRAPTHYDSLLCPLVNELVAVIEEHEPPLSRTSRRLIGLEPRESLGPFARRAGVIFDNASALLEPIATGIKPGLIGV